MAGVVSGGWVRICRAGDQQENFLSSDAPLHFWPSIPAVVVRGRRAPRICFSYTQLREGWGEVARESTEHADFSLGQGDHEVWIETWRREKLRGGVFYEKKRWGW